VNPDLTEYEPQGSTKWSLIPMIAVEEREIRTKLLHELQRCYKKVFALQDE